MFKKGSKLYSILNNKCPKCNEGDFFVTGFSPRKQNLAIYIMPGLAKYPELLNKLGKHKLGKSCLYINKLADIDLSILERLVVASVEDMQEK